MKETSFQRWIGSIQGRDFLATKEGIIRATGTSRQTLANWQSGKGEPSVPNHIRIAYYAHSHGLPAYRPDKIKIIGLQTAIEGGVWINAIWRLSDTVAEERYIPLLKQ